ncbi:DNA-binding domain-containing protein [Paraburkholderia caribensis]|uniref:DNA-binding domain-containing protein n=1 Tax=Paraburkholderia caribensis TaxID=75105 RepID=A0A9Q6SAP8_9BURK|nr:DNA-binding domain-containing protein [Paraburkholderia caribensis]MCO4876369.1 DNA-binding domain-containing protein [Paraburkholderia caribensis]PTB26963.1 DUF2063 domain-containing protein [Paraburkholderia caribensis]QLB67543.1 DUF2063 domain-containing protein [Paraburkholderia caribensis]
MISELHGDVADPSYAASFVSGLLEPMAPPPDDVVARDGKGVALRYNVYRNNVTVSLIDVLAAVYPAVRRITGTEFFRAMARFHVRVTPPASPLLFEYGRDFPAFIESYEHAREMPWLADVARIERAWLDAYHAADGQAMSQEVFSAVAPDRIGSLCFTPHPSARVTRSNYPAVSIFAMNRRDEPVTPICSAESEDALVTRPDQDVLVSRLPPGGAVFLKALIDGASLGEAVSAAFEETSSFDLQGNLAGMIESGAFTGIKFGDS